MWLSWRAFSQVVWDWVSHQCLFAFFFFFFYLSQSFSDKSISAAVVSTLSTPQWVEKTSTLPGIEPTAPPPRAQCDTRPRWKLKTMVSISNNKFPFPLVLFLNLVLVDVLNIKHVKSSLFSLTPTLSSLLFPFLSPPFHFFSPFFSSSPYPSSLCVSGKSLVILTVSMCFCREEEKFLMNSKQLFMFA